MRKSLIILLVLVIAFVGFQGYIGYKQCQEQTVVYEQEKAEHGKLLKTLAEQERNGYVDIEIDWQERYLLGHIQVESDEGIHIYGVYEWPEWYVSPNQVRYLDKDTGEYVIREKNFFEKCVPDYFNLSITEAVINFGLIIGIIICLEKMNKLKLVIKVLFSIMVIGVLILWLSIVEGLLSFIFFIIIASMVPVNLMLLWSDNDNAEIENEEKEPSLNINKEKGSATVTLKEANKDSQIYYIKEIENLEDIDGEYQTIRLVLKVNPLVSENVKNLVIKTTEEGLVEIEFKGRKYECEIERIGEVDYTISNETLKVVEFGVLSEEVEEEKTQTD